ncbi:MAG: glycosyltransferase family 39 protein, partial [Myxococcales bacterium]|nr:glycosyltransferase family 39 protein [Myxococcales bacterium]
MTEPVPPMDDDRALPWPARYDLPALLALGAVVLGVLLPTLGVWEPWEADNAGVARLMRETGAWLSVQVPEVGGRVRAVPELPFGWWPVAATTGLFGVNEIGLRLPGVLAGLGVMWLVIGLTRRTFGRLAGLLAGLSLLSLPLFVFHTRLALGAGL